MIIIMSTNMATVCYRHSSSTYLLPLMGQHLVDIVIAHSKQVRLEILSQHHLPKYCYLLEPWRQIMIIIQDEIWPLKLHASKGLEEILFQDHQLQLLFINHKLCVNFLSLFFVYGTCIQVCIISLLSLIVWSIKMVLGFCSRYRMNIRSYSVSDEHKTVLNFHYLITITTVLNSVSGFNC